MPPLSVTKQDNTGNAPLTVGTSPPSPAGDRNRALFPIMDRSSRNSFLKSYRIQVSSGMSTVIAACCVTPLENVKTRMQTHHFKGILDCAASIWRAEGFRGFTAGTLPPIMSITLVRVTGFSVYQRAKHSVSGAIENLTGSSPLSVYHAPGSLPSLSSVTCFSMAGMTAGFCSAPIACPFELAKNAVQTSVLVSNRSQFSVGSHVDASVRNARRLGMFAVVRKIVSKHGLGGLYKGMHLHILRDTIGSGLYFGIYETTKQVISTSLGEHQPTFGAPMAAGALSGTIPWLLTYPLDTRKTRVQSVLLGEAKEIGQASAAVAGTSMYKGVSVTLFRTMFQNMILLTLFEFFKSEINNLEA